MVARDEVYVCFVEDCCPLKGGGWIGVLVSLFNSDGEEMGWVTNHAASDKLYNDTIYCPKAPLYSTDT